MLCLQPEVQAVGEPLGGSFAWMENYGAVRRLKIWWGCCRGANERMWLQGTQIVFAMADSANNSGGAVGVCTLRMLVFSQVHSDVRMPTDNVLQGSPTAKCSPPSNTTSLSFTADPANNACDGIDIAITGGTPPYTVSVLAP